MSKFYTKSDWFGIAVHELYIFFLIYFNNKKVTININHFRLFLDHLGHFYLKGSIKSNSKYVWSMHFIFLWGGQTFDTLDTLDILDTVDTVDTLDTLDILDTLDTFNISYILYIYFLLSTILN